MQLRSLSDQFDVRAPGARWRLAVVVLLYIAMLSISSLLVARSFPAYHFLFQAEAVPGALIWAAAFAPVFLLFVFAEFSFGYFIGFYFAGMVLGYLWLSHFSDYDYDRTGARLSAIISAIAFLLPALFVSSPVRPLFTMSEPAFERLLTAIFWSSLAVLAVAATYDFRFVAFSDASNVRGELSPLPPILRYLLGITSSAALPFVFACHVARERYWRAGAVLLLLLLYYPVTVAKTELFAPIWLLFVGALFRVFGARPAVMLSLLIPGLVGVVAFFQYQDEITRPWTYFSNVNFRMLAIPSVAIDVYNAFFSKHELTYFCQIGVLKSFMSCPYSAPLAIVMRENFPFGGNFNASLFSTEGIASVGNLLAPIPVLAGGLVAAFANRLSAGLPPFIVLVSSAVLCQILLNVPLSTGLLSYGGGVLFLLWYLTPRTMFGREQREKP